MRILRVCLKIPYPPSDGIRIDPFHTTKVMADLGHEITLVGFQHDKSDISPLTQWCEVHSLPFTGRNTAINLALGFLQQFPINYVKYRDRNLLSRVMKLLQSRSYDVIIVDYSAMGWFALQIRKCYPSIPIITRWHNLDTLIWERWTDRQHHAIKRMLGRLQTGYVRKFERHLALISDVCVLAGAHDTEMLRCLAPAACIEHIPAGIDVDHYAPRSGATAKDILFMASSYKWHANWDAVKWLYDDIMPRIWRTQPGVTLYVTGADLRPEMRQWASRSRVVLTGFVPDERNVLAKCALMVVPMRLGAGIKLKILTALAMGKAVVTTAEGAEGIVGLRDGMQCLIRDSPGDFAAAVTELIDNAQLREQLGAAGRRLVSDIYDWRMLATRWEQVLLAIAAPQMHDPVGASASILAP